MAAIPSNPRNYPPHNRKIITQLIDSLSHEGMRAIRPHSSKFRQELPCDTKPDLVQLRLVNSNALICFTDKQNNKNELSEIAHELKKYIEGIK
jgi:hypothetical protein